jgi:hypothetical protein
MQTFHIHSFLSEAPSAPAVLRDKQMIAGSARWTGNAQALAESSLR